MPPERRDPAYLWDMLVAGRAIMRSPRGVSRERYLSDEDLRLTVERRLEIIGEAARRLSPSFRSEHPEVPWRVIIAQRNVLIHNYDEVDHERIWRVAVEQIPRPIEQLT